MAEFLLPQRSFGPPLHVQPLHAEGFYTRGVPHTFANHGETDARMLVVCGPAALERYFDRVAADHARGVWPSPARPDRDDAIAQGPTLRSSN